MREPEEAYPFVRESVSDPPTKPVGPWVRRGGNALKFVELVRTLVATALAADFLDYALTLVGFVRLTYLLETNPLVVLLGGYIDPYAAVTLVFGITLALVLITYRYLQREVLPIAPYDGSLHDVGRFLVRSTTVRGKDLTLFAVLTMYLLFIHMHLSGSVRWLQLLRETGALAISPASGGAL